MILQLLFFYALEIKEGMIGSSPENGKKVRRDWVTG